MKNKFIWDSYSDQPCIIKDKKYKKMMRRRHLYDYLPLFIYNLVFFPLAAATSGWFKVKPKTLNNFFALCVNLDKGQQQVQLVEELGCKNLQIRFPLADIDNLPRYVAFASKFADCQILINILQDRNNIDDSVLLQRNIALIFKAFKGLVTTYQIGNAINRSKWGFFSVGEYLKFYQLVQSIRDRDFSDYILIGPSVIDYEYHFTIRALFNHFKVKFDKVSALLYVDRRGAPENRQMLLFDTRKKIDFLYALTKLSWRCTSDIIISEANWPISDTAPWAPTSETECVDEDDYCNYMLRYHFLALATGKVQSLYWHQLIAPGYGLIDARDGLRKRSAYQAYKVMLELLQNSTVLEYQFSEQLYRLVCDSKGKKIEILWLNQQRAKRYETDLPVLDKLGVPISADIWISQSPIYVLHNAAV
ncbi:MAG: hypothetical protein OFPI_29170 [Osedax symbiont Rs2]|nr:MAG: hypothetical protein OFPI_29170 [Osedax symbiont Rs2]